MADQAMVDRLLSQRDSWNAWRASLPQTTCIDLTFADLAAADLRDLDFHSASCIGTRFRNADLREARLGNADLRNANLSHAQLQAASLDGAQCDNALFEGADLSEANCTDARFCMADLTSARFHQANLHTADCSFARCIGTDLTGAILSGANWRGAVLTDVDLTNAVMGGTIFGNTYLRSVSGWETVTHLGPSIIGADMLARSDELPKEFLREAGIGEPIIQLYDRLHLSRSTSRTCCILAAPAEQGFVEGLRISLRQHGVSCWYYPAHMAGDNPQAPFELAMANMYDLLLLVVSPALERLGFITSFLTYLIGQDQIAQRQRVVPLLLRPGGLDGLLDLGSVVKGGSPIDATEWRDPTAWNRIVQEIAILVRD